MSKRQFETIVSICQFQNIDIYQQGYYQIRLKFEGARLAKASKSSQSELKKNSASFKQPVCMPDSTYQSHVFYIRYREEQVNFGEIIQFFITQPQSKDDYQGKLTFELWFYERAIEEIKTGLPPEPIYDTSKFRMVNSKQVGFLLESTFEHFMVTFDTGYTSSMQINILSIQKYSLDLVAHNHKDTTKVNQLLVQQRQQQVEQLSATYDKLRLLHSGLCETLSPPVFQDVHAGKQVKFGPLRFDSEPPAVQFTEQKSKNIKYASHISLKKPSFVDQEFSSSDDETSKGRVMSPILQQNRVLHTSLSRVNENSHRQAILSQNLFTQRKSTQPLVISAAVPSAFTAQSVIHQQRQHRRKMSDEISSSSSDSVEDLSHNISRQANNRKVKSIFNMQYPLPNSNFTPKHHLCKEEDIPFFDFIDKPRQIRQETMNRNFQQKKPGSRYNLTHQMSQATIKATRITCFVFELWHYISKIILKALEQYMKQQKELHTRIIVTMEEENHLRIPSIRQSGIRVKRKNERPVDEQEIEQEPLLLQPNKRGQRPQLKLPKEAMIPSASKLSHHNHQHQQRSKSSNISCMPITPHRIEQSQILAQNRRFDVTTQPEVAPLLPHSEKQRVYLINPKKNTTEPIIIEEIFYDEEQLFSETMLQPQTKSSHLFVFVHGFQATSSDLQLFKNHLHVLLPNALFLVSKSNEKLTDSPIQKLGLNLAQEVKQYIQHYLMGGAHSSFKRQNYLKKLTFIGHSLGGIIVRESLKHLQQYSQQMHGFVSLGSPHLGYMYNSSSLVDAGMWFLKQWTQSDSLKQLSMTDASDFNQSYLFKLSEDKNISNFKYVVLVGSFQDSYVPYDSARIQVCMRAIEKNSKNRQTYLKMSDNILKNLNCRQLLRLDVNFKIEDKTLASMIGRTAHIQMIESESSILALLHKYHDVFTN